MQSSTGTFLRGVILVLCVVVVPLAALFSGNVPEATKDFFRQQLTNLTEKLGGSHSEASTPAASPKLYGAAPQPAQEVPAFAPQWSVEASKRAPSPSPLSALPPLTPLSQPAPAVSEATRMPSPAPAGAIQASYEERSTPTWPENAAGDATSRPVPPNAQPPATLPAMPPAAQGIPNFGMSAGPENQAAAGARAATPPSGDRLAQLQNRLRELGVGYYLLETWGEQGQLFRFYCRVAVAGNPTCSHYFDAVDADPLAAMGKVIQQVEAWRAAGR